jgi:hypothetical protein
MSASQVVLYFDSEQDALHFTLAASSVMSAQANRGEAAAKVAEEICKVSRIATDPLHTVDDQAPAA